MDLSTYLFCIPLLGLSWGGNTYFCIYVYFLYFGYAKLACAVFAQSEILDVLVEWYSTIYSRLICNGIGESNGCANPVPPTTTMMSGRCPLLTTAAATAAATSAELQYN